MTFHYPRYTSWGKRHPGWAAIANGVILFVVILVGGMLAIWAIGWAISGGRVDL